MRSSVRFALAGLLASAAFVSPAAAQRFDRVVAFGDSYADIGNVKGILTDSGLGVLYPSAEYPTGRFSGGTNFVDTIATTYGIPQDNYAIGGAEAGTGNVAGQGLLPGFQQQWTAFTNGGSTYGDILIPFPIHVSGTQTTIPSGGLSFASNDLVVLSVGGNDARDYRENGGTLAGADAAAATVAAQATAGIDALVARGIRHMVFTVGDVGQLAEAIGQPSAATGTAFSVGYNTRMQTTLAHYAAAGIQVAYVDITQVGNVVRANPGRFGFGDITTACPQACIGNPALQSQYFFYVDGVHLTSNAFAMVGRYAVNQLNAPYGFRAGGDLPRLAAQSFGRAIGSRADLARGRGDRDGLSVFGMFTADRQRHAADETSNRYSYHSRGGFGGVEYGMGPATFGAIVSYTHGHADGAGDDRAGARSYQAGGYAVVDDGKLFTQAYGGYGWHDVHIRRTGAVDPLTASPRARSWVAGVRVGYLTPAGPLRIGPTVAIDYAHARLRGYVEASDPAASLTVDAQRSQSLLGSAGLEARFTGLARFVPWLRVAAEKDLDGDSRTVRYAPTVAPGIVDSFAIGSSSKTIYGAATGGLTAKVAGPLSIDLDGRATFSRDVGNEAAAFVGVRLKL